MSNREQQAASKPKDLPKEKGSAKEGRIPVKK